MLQRVLAACMAVVSVSGFISLGCRPLPTTETTPTSHAAPSPSVQLAVATIGPVAEIPAPPPAPAPAPVEAPPAVRVRASRGIVRPRAAGVASVVGGDIWGSLSRCEAGGRPGAVSSNGRYFGAFQFSLGTWHGLGMPGSPIDFSYGEQLAVAQRLQARSGWGQWPVCARHLGLL